LLVGSLIICRPLVTSSQLQLFPSVFLKWANPNKLSKLVNKENNIGLLFNSLLMLLDNKFMKDSQRAVMYCLFDLWQGKSAIRFFT